MSSANGPLPIEWISLADAADILGVDRSTVYRSVTNPEWRAERWGKEREGWRRKPLTRRTIYQVSRARAQELAKLDDSA